MDAPAVAVSADGKTIAVAWMDMRSGREERDVFWRVLRKGKTEGETALDDSREGVQGHVALAMGEKGEIHAFWESEGAIRYRRSEGGEIATVSESAERQASQPSAAARGGIVVAAYECRERGEKFVVVRKVR